MNKWKKLVKEREISPERGMGETGTACQIMEKTGVSCAAVPRFYHMGCFSCDKEESVI